MKTKIYYDSMGYTQKSLQNLRNELARKIDNNISTTSCIGRILKE